MQIGDRVRIRLFKYRLKAYWNGYCQRPEDYIGEIGFVSKELHGWEPIDRTNRHSTTFKVSDGVSYSVKFEDGYEGWYSKDKLEILENKN